MGGASSEAGPTAAERGPVRGRGLGIHSPVGGEPAGRVRVALGASRRRVLGTQPWSWPPQAGGWLVDPASRKPPLPVSFLPLPPPPFLSALLFIPAPN